MRRLLVDVNVVLDVLLDREPHAAASAALWRAVEEKRVDGLITAHGFTTLFYLVGRARNRETARTVIADLLVVFGVAPVDEEVLHRAATLPVADFEDAVVAAAAEAAGCEAIVTRDAHIFAGCPLAAVDPLLALAALDDEVHESAVPYPPPRRRARARS